MFKHYNIKRAQVFGMRCSGTNYLDSLLTKNFPSVKVASSDPKHLMVFGWKHGDIGMTPYGHHNGKQYDIPLTHLDWPKSGDTLLFVIYRSPMTWLQSLYLSPHHSPESYGVEFSTFIRQQWRAYRCDPGKENAPSKTVRMQQVRQKNILESFSSPFMMRQAKIHIFESFKYRFQNVVYLNIEHLKQDPERYLRAISEQFDLQMEPQFQDVTTYKGGASPYVETEYEPISSTDLLYSLEKIDWRQEKVTGYSARLRARIMTLDETSGYDPDSLLHLRLALRCYNNGQELQKTDRERSIENWFRMSLSHYSF